MAAVTSSCAIFHTATPAERAHELLPKCGHVTPELTTFVLSKEAIESVEPALFYRITGNDHVMVLHGALIHVRPAPGPDGDMFEITVSAASFEDRQALLDRARSYRTAPAARPMAQ